jgi:hypothetical protein
VKRNRFAHLSEMIDGRPLLSEKFEFTGPHELTATTWMQEGAPDQPVPVTVDLATAFEKLKPN